MTARRFALAVFLLCGCGGARERPEPPSGAVDPGSAGLATPGRVGSSTPDAIDPTPGGIAGPPMPPAAAPPAAAPRPQAPPEPPTGEATGSIVVTRAHCEALGRKFAELTLEQGGVLGGVDEAGKREAEGVGKTFADRCAHDMVGQTVAAREYACMLRARSADALLGCKK